MKTYEVVFERREVYREVFSVEADSVEEAEELAEEMNCEHDWTENEIIHGTEDIVQTREVEDENRNVGVHKTHCCILHGCKYGDDDCPVENGSIKQSYLCESCDHEGIASLEELNEVTNGNKKVCPHCNHVL